MKIMVEKHICDICGKEVTTDKRYLIIFEEHNNWSNDATVEYAQQKDLCEDCYETMLGFVDKNEIRSESKSINEEPKRKRGDYDKEEVKRLWVMGLKYRQIASRLNITPSMVRNTIYRMSKEEKEQAYEKYGIHKNHVQEDQEEIKRFKVTTDEYGLVHSIEEEG